MQDYSFAVTVTSVDGRWLVKSFPDDFTNPRTAIMAVRSLRAEAAAFALLCVEDEYFVIARPGPNGTAVFLSDVTMAVDDDFAAGWAAEANLEVPDIAPEDLDDVDPLPDGDFAILGDLGVGEELLSVFVDDPDLAPSEALERIAEELGCLDELNDAIDG
ncbi:tRNA adenosine deaminase-associated protein [Corynebacterium uterequi]|uniref:Putative tRNA adenosine deaminase-associated protein n=1 Tax=Corynebacterium uterequi TaxID=1072256 RepID=A0A0G3HGA8_9CORY|nr:tRNA adenosine deaminase-associated protein [Corynebacterium uterequi]AKK10147.1 putative tRNA adenosine deaminase-associated protein [Corynebacterium uterequi]